MLMDKIIVLFNIGDYDQSIAIYKQDRGVELESAPTDSLVDTIIGFCKKYSINNIDLVGNAAYLEKYKKDFFTKYDCENLNINIVSR